MEQTRDLLNREAIIWGVLFSLLIIGSYFFFIPALTGIFIFDDIANLSPLGKYSDFSLWDNFWLFLLEGNSGPTGRPISLASFYLNDISWKGAYPSEFIQTNIYIHLLNGVLVFWFFLKLGNKLKLHNKIHIFITLFASAFWLLHPMQSTTVLYVIQRMTELSATFMLTGMIFYLYGREQLNNKPMLGLSMLFIGTGISLILALLSKENGILLVGYILVIEYFLLRPLGQKPAKYFNIWFIPAVIIPFITILVYLGLHTNPNNFSFRDFSLTERLLTEPRILFDYLYHILIPDMSYFSLFHDDYKISNNLFTPLTTLPAILGIIILIGTAFYLRKKVPVIAFAIAWFFVGHLIESTVLPLELYFEHRNYLPMLGIGFALAWYLADLFFKQKLLVSLIVTVVLGLNTFILYQNTSLWGKPLELSVSWIKAHPHSERTHLLYVYVFDTLGIKIEQNMRKPFARKQSQFYVALRFLLLKESCQANLITPEMLGNTINIVQRNPIHISVREKLQEFMTAFEERKCTSININQIEQFLLHLATINGIQNNRYIAHDINAYLSNIYQEKKNLPKTMYYLNKAYAYLPTLKTLKMRAFLLTSAGLYDEALKVLNDTSALKNTFRKKLAMKIKQKELDKFKKIIIESLKNTERTNS